MGWGICHFHNNGNIIESFESKHAKQQAWLCFDMVHVIMWLLTMYALFSVIGCASITQAIFQCKKAAPFSWTHINQQCTGRFKFVAVVGGCIVWLQEQSSQFRLLIAMSTCDVDQAALATSAAQCVGIFGIMESACLHLALHLCSPLGVGFPPLLLTFSSCSYHWFPMYDDSTKRNSHAILMASTSL
mgnify:CR=1 FL=1